MTLHYQVRNSLKRESAETNEQLISDYERKSARFTDLEWREEKVEAKQMEAGKANVC